MPRTTSLLAYATFAVGGLECAPDGRGSEAFVFAWNELRCPKVTERKGDSLFPQRLNGRATAFSHRLVSKRIREVPSTHGVCVRPLTSWIEILTLFE
jgi:hypothetical protein